MKVQKRREIEIKVEKKFVNFTKTEKYLESNLILVIPTPPTFSSRIFFRPEWVGRCEKVFN